MLMRKDDDMNIRYRCCICDSLYDWYDGVYENSEYDYNECRKAKREGKEYDVDCGVFIGANAIRFTRFQPSPDRYGQTLEEDNSGLNNLEDCVINLCPDCMRKLLKKTKPENSYNCFLFA